MANSNDWVSDVLDSLGHVETPRLWLWYSLIAAVSASAANNYHMPILKGAVIVKPNIYVILLGESGLGKELPVQLAQELVSRANVTRVIAGRSSIQAILKELSMAQTRPDKPPITDSRAFIVNGELSTAIIEDPSALTLLTDLYDRKTRWTNTLKGTGSEQLKDTYVTTLFGSSYSHFYERIPQANIEGGYVGRNFIVEETKLFQQTDLLDDKEETENIFETIMNKFVPHLEKINKGGGRIVYDVEAREYFNNWRTHWREENPPGCDKTGFKARVPVHVLKVAMCLLLSDYEAQQTLIMNREHLEEAIIKVSNLSYGTQRLVDGQGSDPLSAQTKLVLDYLINAEGNSLTRKQLLVRGYGNYTAQTLDQILTNLKEIDWIRKDRIFEGKNSDWNIHLAGRPLEQYITYLEKAQAQRMKKNLAKEGI